MPRKLSLTRRRALWLGLGACLGMGTVTGAKAAYKRYQILALDDPTRDFTVTGNAPLKARAQAKGLIYGSSARYKDLIADPDLANELPVECNMLVPEWEMKWSAGDALLRPTPDRFDFTLADRMAEFAQHHQMLLRGHTLIWHLCVPSWFETGIHTDNAEQLLTQHIQTVAGRYAGKIHSWDVVNEAIEPRDGRSDGLRETLWLKCLGADYIDLAFRTAATADPDALLVYNDYGLEYDTFECEARRIAILKLLERLKAQGTPIHAVGLQSHLDGSETCFNAEKFRRFLSDIASLGLKILITELDVEDKNLPADVAVRDRIVASAYEDFLSVALDETAVIAVITWGLNDPYSWLAETSPRSDGLPIRPLPLDESLNRKLAWQAIARCFDQCPKR